MRDANTDPSTATESEQNSSYEADRRSVLKAGLAGLGTVATGASTVPTASAVVKDDYNLAHALQQSLYFFDANDCGEGVTGEPLEWRGDCHLVDKHVRLRDPVDEGGSNIPPSYVDAHSDVLEPGEDGTVDLEGGYHDAGDHVQFGLPQSFAASGVGWALYEFEDAFRETGTYDHIVEHLRGFTDFFLKCLFRDDDGSVVAYVYQTGNGNFDHNYWGPPELQDNEEMPRPAYAATPETPAADQCGGAAAALALQYLNLQDEDPDYAERCLQAARDLYQFGVDNPGLGHGGTFYPSSGQADELAWAAVWLHIATGEDGYLEDVVGTDGAGNYTGHVGEIIASTESGWDNTWVHSWDTVWSGVFVKLAAITDDQKWTDIARWNLEYWSGGAVSHDGGSGNYIQTTPAGFSWLNQWGSARYNAAAQFLAAVYRKQGGEKGEALTDWAHSQMRYIMGDNPFGYSLIVGFTEDHADEPHHDAAHGSYYFRPEKPEKPRHTLYGALVGGPDSNDNHNDQIEDYVSNEVAIDYNTGLVGALAGLYTYYGEGDEPVEDFPPAEERHDPFYVEGSVKNNDGSVLEVESYLYAVTAYPPRFEDGLSFRYYLDASEYGGSDASVEDLGVSIYYDQASRETNGQATATGPTPVEGEEDLYYVEFDYSGANLAGWYELTWALTDYTNSSVDPSNDPSFQGLSSERQRVDTLPVFVDGELVYGDAPGLDGDTTAPTTPPSLSVTSRGETTLGISWIPANDEGTGVDQYELLVDGTVERTVDAGTTSATLSDLTADTTYDVAVVAIDGAGNRSSAATVTASTTGGTATGPPPLNGVQPTDPDDDGIYEDLTGNDEIDNQDVVTFFQNMGSEGYLAENVEYYDISGNDDIDYQDLIALFGEIGL